MNDKLRVDAVMYPEERDQISYAFHQLAQPIFQQLDAWINANAEDLSIEDFYKQIEHSMGIHMLVEKAKDKLHVLTMKPTGKTVDDYYQRIFKLWEQAGTTERKKVRKFEITLKPSISHALISQKHTKIIDVLDAAREIEHQKHQISIKFARDSAKLFQKSLGSLGSSRSSGRTWGKNGSLPQVNGSSSAGANLAASGVFGSSSAAPRNNGKLVNTLTNPNSKFIPTATKPAGWVGTWYNPEVFPRKLQDSERTMLLQQKKCWGCRGSGHRGSDKCCLLTNRKARLNVTTARAVEVSDSENLEKA